MAENREAIQAKVDRFLDVWMASPEVYTGSKPVAVRQRERLRMALIELVEEGRAPVADTVPTCEQWIHDLPEEVGHAHTP